MAARAWQVAREKSLLQQCSHPFVLRCVASLQDASALHLLFEFCAGGELLRLLQQSDRGALDGASPSQRNLHPTLPHPYPYP
jgi:hypothetical protein